MSKGAKLPFEDIGVSEPYFRADRGRCQENLDDYRSFHVLAVR